MAMAGTMEELHTTQYSSDETMQMLKTIEELTKQLDALQCRYNETIKAAERDRQRFLEEAVKAATEHERQRLLESIEQMEQAKAATKRERQTLLEDAEELKRARDNFERAETRLEQENAGLLQELDAVKHQEQEQRKLTISLKEDHAQALAALKKEHKQERLDERAQFLRDKKQHEEEQNQLFNAMIEELEQQRKTLKDDHEQERGTLKKGHGQQERPPSTPQTKTATTDGLRPQGSSMRWVPKGPLQPTSAPLTINALLVRQSEENHVRARLDHAQREEQSALRKTQENTHAAAQHLKRQQATAKKLEKAVQERNTRHARAEEKDKEATERDRAERTAQQDAQQPRSAGGGDRLPSGQTRMTDYPQTTPSRFAPLADQEPSALPDQPTTLSEAEAPPESVHAHEDQATLLARTKHDVLDASLKELCGSEPPLPKNVAHAIMDSMKCVDSTMDMGARIDWGVSRLRAGQNSGNRKSLVKKIKDAIDTYLLDHFLEKDAASTAATQQRRDPPEQHRPATTPLSREESLRSRQVFVRLPCGQLKSLLEAQQPHLALAEAMKERCGSAPTLPFDASSKLFRAGSTGAFIITIPSRDETRQYIKEKSILFSRLRPSDALRGVSIQPRRMTVRGPSVSHAHTSSRSRTTTDKQATSGRPGAQSIRILPRGEPLNPNAEPFRPESREQQEKQQTSTGRSQ